MAVAKAWQWLEVATSQVRPAVRSASTRSLAALMSRTGIVPTPQNEVQAAESEHATYADLWPAPRFALPEVADSYGLRSHPSTRIL